jgi:hypothetical protein
MKEKRDFRQEPKEADNISVNSVSLADVTKGGDGAKSALW